MPYKDPAVAKAYRDAWWTKHRSEQILRLRKRYHDDPKYYRQRSKEGYEKHPEAQTKYRLKRRLAYPWRHLLKGAKERSIKKNVPFSLTEEWASAKWTGRCELTGLEFVTNGLGSGPKPRSPSIDRRIPSIGYTSENCRFVLSCINSFKHEGTEEEMYEVAESLLKMRPPLFQ